MIDRTMKKDIDQAVMFLRCCRSVSISPENKTRFVIAGSTNIMYSLEGMGLVDSINDLCPIKLRPFDVVTAEQYVQAVSEARGFACEPNISKRILDLLGEPIPYLLALFMQTLFSRRRISKDLDEVSLVDTAFDDLLDSGAAVFLHS